MSEIIQDFDSSFSRCLHAFYGEEPFTARALTHGDIDSPPDVRGTFSLAGADGVTDTEARGEWMLQQCAETPGEDDAGSIQGWTYVADYSVHPCTPNTRLTGRFYIHARIDSANRLQFGIFQSPSGGHRRSSSRPLALIAPGPALQQLRHGDAAPPLRIAPKEEAQRVLLVDGRLRMEACPRFAGVLHNWGMAKVKLSGKETRTTSSGTKELPYGPHFSTIYYYGHIWSYWYTVINNVLHFVGIPVYTSDEQGSIVYTYQGTKNRRNGEWVDKQKRAQVNLPPTEDDLKSSGFSVQRVRKADYISAPTLGFDSAFLQTYGYINRLPGEADARSLLGSQGVTGADPFCVCRRPVARIEATPDGGFILHQLQHGDIYANTSAIGFLGGVFRDSQNALIPASLEEVSHVSTNPSTGGPVSSGVSGYIPACSRYNLEGLAAITAQAFHVSRYGAAYNIEIKGGAHPFVRYAPEITLPECDVALTCNFTSNTSGGSQDDDDDDDDNPPPIPPPGGDDVDEDDDDHEKPGHIDLGDLGFWYQAASGVSVSAKRDRDDKSVLRYIFTVEVTQNVTLQHKLVYNVTAHFAVADGGSYPVLDNGSVTMWYGLTSSPGEVTVHNLTSSSWSGAAWVANEHPDSASDFVLSVFRTAYMTAQFDPTDLRSDAPFQSGNIISFHRTGRTKRVGGSIRSAPGARSRYAYGRMEIVEIQLNPAIVKQVLRNFAIKNAPQEVCTVSPSSIRGDSQGCAAGDPVVSVSAPATAKNASAYPLPGATKATGPISMYVIGSFGSAVASYSVQGDFSGWFEGSPSNRKNASISGQFDVTVPARRINRQPA